MEDRSGMAGLADALGDVRRRIKALKSEEAALRRAILDARPNGPVTGRGFSVEVRVHSARRFDSKLLPDHIRSDPAYCKLVETRTVVTKAARAPSAALRKEEEFDVFEPY